MSAVLDDDPTDPLPALDLFDFDAPEDRDARRPRRTARTTSGATSTIHTDVRPDPIVGWDVMDWDVDGWHESEATDDVAGVDTNLVAARWEIADEDRRRGHLDPVVLRLGMLVAVVAIAVPFVLGMMSSSSPMDQVVAVADTVATTAAPVADPTAATSPSAPVTGAAVLETSPTEATAGDRAAPVATTPPATERSAAELDTSTEQATTSSDGSQETAPASVSTAAPACGAEYDVVAGDYWIRLADGAGVRLADLLAVNGATIDTMLVPGRSICLPAGAKVPSPPPSTPATQPAPTTAAPTTAAPTTAAPTTAAPTTAAPTTTVRPASRAEVEAIIREVWPDDLEERALEIAWRESNHIPTAKNWCCYGLFQIHWNAHSGWLDDLGITSASQLLDARTNANAAYVLYQRAGGFGPWGG